MSPHTLPHFNVIDGMDVINKTSFEQWRRDVGGFTGAPEFHSVDLSRGSSIWVATRAEFTAWFNAKWPSAAPSNFVSDDTPAVLPPSGTFSAQELEAIHVEDDNIPDHTYPDQEDETK